MLVVFVFFRQKIHFNVGWHRRSSLCFPCSGSHPERSGGNLLPSPCLYDSIIVMSGIMMMSLKKEEQKGRLSVAHALCGLAISLARSLAALAQRTQVEHNFSILQLFLLPLCNHSMHLAEQSSISDRKGSSVGHSTLESTESSSGGP
jgi:hypothetical protein